MWHLSHCQSVMSLINVINATLPGLEPGIPWFVVRCLIHWATRPRHISERCFNTKNNEQLLQVTTHRQRLKKKKLFSCVFVATHRAPRKDCLQCRPNVKRLVLLSDVFEFLKITEAHALVALRGCAAQSESPTPNFQCRFLCVRASISFGSGAMLGKLCRWRLQSILKSPQKKLSRKRYYFCWAWRLSTSLKHTFSFSRVSHFDWRYKCVRKFLLSLKICEQRNR